MGLLGMTGWAFVARWQFLDTSPYPFGIDGYYYPIQLRSLLSGAGLHYPSAPLAFYLMLPLAAFAGPIPAVKLSAALGTALATIPAYLIVRRTTGDRGAGLVAAALVTVSQQSFYFCTEFVKNGIGITLALMCLASLGASLDDRSAHPVRRLLVPLLLLGATYATHKAAFGLSVAFCLPPLTVWFVRQLRHRGNPVRWRRFLLWSAAGLVLGSLALVMAGVASPRRFLSWHDLDRLLDLRAEPRAYELLYSEVTYAAWAATALVACFGLSWIVQRLRQRIATDQAPRAGADAMDEPTLEARALVIGPMVYACVMALPALASGGPFGLAFRLRLMSFSALIICAPTLLARCVGFRWGHFWPAPRVAEPTTLTAKGTEPWPATAPASTSRVALALRLTRSAVTLATAAALLVLVPKTHDEGVVRANERWLPGVRSLQTLVPPDSRIIVSSLQLSYVIKWETGLEAICGVPAHFDSERTYRVLEPAHGVSLAECRAFEANLPPGLEPPAHPDPESQWLMTLFPERTWRAFLDFLPPGMQTKVEPWPLLR
jgi:hypothetical protein